METLCVPSYKMIAHVYPPRVATAVADAGSTSEAAETKPPARAERFVTHFSPAKGLLAAPAAASPYSESPRSLSRAAGREWNGGKHRICIPWTDEEDAFLLQLRGEGGGLLVPSPVKKNFRGKNNDATVMNFRDCAKALNARFRPDAPPQRQRKYGAVGLHYNKLNSCGTGGTPSARAAGPGPPPPSAVLASAAKEWPPGA